MVRGLSPTSILRDIKPGDKAKLLVESGRNLWPREELRESRMRYVPSTYPKEAGALWHGLLGSHPKNRRNIGPLFLIYSQWP